MNTQTRILAIVLLLLSIPINGYVALNLYCGDCIPVVAQVNHIAHWITLSSFLLLVVVVIFRLPLPVLVLQIPGILAFMFWFGPQLVPKSAIQPGVASEEFTALVFNQGGFTYGTPGPKLDLLLESDADIVGIFEYDFRMDADLQTTLTDMYPYQYVYPEGYDGGWGDAEDFRFLSRFPIVSSNEYVPYFMEGEAFLSHRFIRVELDMDGVPLAVYLFHPTRPPYDIGTTYDDTQLKENLARLLQALAHERLPKLLLCDCNFSPRSPQYSEVDAILDDSFALRGWGFGLTTSGLAGVRSLDIDFPLVRSDYIWTSIEVKPLDVEVRGSLTASDHLMVWGRFSINRYLLE